MDDSLKFPNQNIQTQFENFLDHEEIKALISSLAHGLSKKYKNQELIVIGALKGSLCFMADLVRELKNMKIYVDFFKIEAVGRSEDDDGTIRIVKDIETNIKDKNVLIVEDIIDTGRALNFIKERLLLSKPAQLEIITLFDKPYQRSINIQADYIGTKIQDEFIVGYGLDLEEYGRNFENTYYLKYPQ